MRLFQNYFSIFGNDFSVDNFFVILFLFGVAIWAICSIIWIIKNVFKSINTLRGDIKNNETELNKLGMSDADKEKKKEYDKAINKILESENLLILGRYLTIVISALLLVLVVVIIGLVIIVK